MVAHGTAQKNAENLVVQHVSNKNVLRIANSERELVQSLNARRLLMWAINWVARKTSSYYLFYRGKFLEKVEVEDEWPVCLAETQALAVVTASVWEIGQGTCNKNRIVVK